MGRNFTEKTEADKARRQEKWEAWQRIELLVFGRKEKGKVMEEKSWDDVKSGSSDSSSLQVVTQSSHPPLIHKPTRSHEIGKFMMAMALWLKF